MSKSSTTGVWEGVSRLKDSTGSGRRGKSRRVGKQGGKKKKNQTKCIQRQKGLNKTTRLTQIRDIELYNEVVTGEWGKKGRTDYFQKATRRKADT